MRPILIDTNAYASFKKGEISMIEIIQQSESIAVSPIMLGELLAGFDGGSKMQQNKIELQKFLESPRVKIYPVTLDTSHYFSLIYCSLKSKGKPIPTNDMWIAAQAMEHGCVVCTYDKHFTYIEGIIAGNTLEELIL
ncbi:MAG: type II toxin-antitoxin system VapC family toxin [Chlamydiales bacterium]